MNVRIVIPGYGQNVHAVYLQRIARIAGGFTSWRGIGGWRGGQYELEPVTVVDVSVAGTIDDTIGDTMIVALRSLARTIARDMNQTCVFMSIDDIAEYVTP